MPLTPQKSNFISELMNWSALELQQRAVAQDLIARWNLNAIGSGLDDVTVQAVFPHLTAQEITDAVVAAQAVLTAMGDNVSGQATNLIKMKG